MVPGPRICPVVLLLIWTSVTGCNTVPQRTFVPPVIPVVQQGHPNQGQEMASHFSVSSAPVAQNVIATPDTTLLAAVLQPAPPPPTPVPQLSSPNFSGELIASRFHTKGPGRLGKHFFTLSLTGDRSGNDTYNKRFGTPVGFEGEINIPVNSLTDFRLKGRYENHKHGTTETFETTVLQVDSIIEGGSVAAGFRHRLTSTPHGSPFVGAMIGYVDRESQSYDRNNPSDKLVYSDFDHFTWEVSLGGEAIVSPTTSVLLGVEVGNHRQQESNDVGVQFFVTSPWWLSPTLFTIPRISTDFDDNWRFGIDMGITF
jgi:hypothetical protein